MWLSVAYLAPVYYYASALAARKVYIEQHDNYVKQTYRNRCQIVTGNGVIPLSIPVDKGDSGKCLTRDIRLSHHSDWQTLHWRSFVAAYNSSPFFEYYMDDLLPFYERKWNFLFDFDCELQSKIVELLDVDVDITLTESYKDTFESHQLDLRESIHPKKSPEKDDFHCQILPYYQVFDTKFGFIPNMSIIDLLFNMGPESGKLLKEMIK